MNNLFFKKNLYKHSAVESDFSLYVESLRVAGQLVDELDPIWENKLFRRFETGPRVANIFIRDTDLGKE